MAFKGFYVNLEEAESQFRQIRSMDWKEDSPWGDCVPNDSVKFWSGVRSHRAGEKEIFLEMADYALGCLAIHVSNAYVGSFSIVSFMKDKYANRMKIPMLDSLLLIKTHLQIRKICCKDFEVTKLMLSYFNKNMYDFKKKDIVSDEENLERVVILNTPAL